MGNSGVVSGLGVGLSGGSWERWWLTRIGWRKYSF